MKIQIRALCLVSLAAGMWAQAPTAPTDNTPLKNWDAPLHWMPPSAPAGLREKGASPDAAGATQPLQLVAITPCRVMDTRNGSGFSGAFGPPSLFGGVPRIIPIPSSSCGIPSSAAYSLNFTLISTYGPVGFVAAWPDNVGFPGTSITNAFNGGVIANAAVVPAGPDGGINVMVSNIGDVIIDINGYYVSGGGGGGAQGVQGYYALSNNASVIALFAGGIHVAPGAQFTVPLSYLVPALCPFCTEQIVVGIAGQARAQACAFSGDPSVGGTVNGLIGTSTVTLTAPSGNYIYFIEVHSDTQLNCTNALANNAGTNIQAISVF